MERNAYESHAHAGVELVLLAPNIRGFPRAVMGIIVRRGVPASLVLPAVRSKSQSNLLSASRECRRPMGPWRIPTLADVRSARSVIRRHLAPTPLRRYPALDRLLGFSAYVKHENHLPTGAFKVRGGINLVSRLPENDRKRGVIAASTGNHGQSVAYAAQTFGVPATIVVPEKANPVKVESMKALGARVLFHGPKYDEARRYAESLAARRRYRYVHSGNEPHLIAGVGTYALEMLEEAPVLDAILVPVGGGSGAAGCCVVAHGLGDRTRIVGVQSAQAPAAFRSWRAGSLVEAPNRTMAEGLATGTAFELPQQVLRQHLSDFTLVTDDQIRKAIRIHLEKTRNLVEGAGAASLAAGLKLRRRLRGKKVGLILSGGNLSVEQLRGILDSG